MALRLNLTMSIVVSQSKSRSLSKGQFSVVYGHTKNPTMPCSHWPLMSVCIVKIKANWHTGTALNANELMEKEGSAPGSSRQLSEDGFYVVLSGIKSLVIQTSTTLWVHLKLIQTTVMSQHPAGFFWGGERMLKGSYGRENSKKLLIWKF